jgi:NTE family protein
MKQKVGLVLSGGGARGIAHLGVIETLEENGFEISSISGTSMGALVGAIYANGQLKAYKDWLYSLKKIDVFKLMDFTLSKQGFVKGDKIFKKMSEFIGDRRFEDLAIPLTVTATNISLKKEVVFNKGSIIDAVRASVSIPTVFTPVKKDGHFLIDGGVVNNLPISNLIRTENDIVVVSDVTANNPSANIKLKLNYIDIVSKSIMMLIEKVSEHTIELYQPEIVVQISGDSAGLLDFHKAKKMLELGRKVTADALTNQFKH